MKIVTTTLRDGDSFKDVYEVCETPEDAERVYAEALAQPNIYCACIADITKATEPHWVEEEA